MCGTGVIGGDDGSSVVDGFDGIENSLVNGYWMNFRVFLLGTDIERTETGETVVVDCCGGCMGDASVVNLIFVAAVFDTILVGRRIRRTGRTFVNHITMFYLRAISFYN